MYTESVTQRVKIVTDSLADLPAAWAAELDITIVPANLHFGLETFRDQLDISTAEFYDRLTSSPLHPTTSAASVGTFIETYRALLREDCAIVSIHVPAALSATFNSAYQAAREFPERRIVVMDGTTLSMGLGWLAIVAARAVRMGMDLDQVVARVEETIPRVRLFAVLDTLEYAHRGGRVSWIQAQIGSLLQIKPILQVIESRVELVERTRTRGRALERLAEMALGLAPFEELCVLHMRSAGQADLLRQMVGSFFPVDRIATIEAGPVLGVHTGPGAVGLAGIRQKGL